MAEQASTTITNSQNVVLTGNLSAGGDNTITQDAEIQNLSRRTTTNIQDRTRGMVRTSALKAVVDKLTTGTTWITITGQPGEGKTTAAFMALGELQQSGRQVFHVISPEELTKVIATYPNAVVMLGDIFGALEFNQSEWSQWEAVFHQVLGGKEHLSGEKRTETTKKNEMSVILVGRDYVINSSSPDIRRFSDYFTSDEHVVYMLKPGERAIQEKLDIWNAISKDSGIELDEETIDSICESSVPHGFPHVCKLFVTMRQKDANINAESFFEAPLSFLNQTVQKFLLDKVKLCLFKEMIKRNGSVNIRDLGNVDNSLDIIEAANNLVGSYLNNENGNYTFNHPSIYDSVAFNICKKIPLFVIENCHLSFLHERLQLDTQPPTSNSESNLVVYIPRSCIVDLAKRFAVEIENRNLRLVLSHKALADQFFIEELMRHITLPLTELLTLTETQIGFLGRKKGQSFLSLVASNKSPQLLKYVANQTDIQLTERDINTVLDSVCRYDASDVLKYLENQRLGPIPESQLCTVLYEVCKYGAYDVLTYLVQSRDTLDINVRYNWDKTPLMIASYTRDSRFVQQLMSLCPDLNARDSRLSLTVLHYLCQNGLVKAVEEVIDSVGGVDVKHEYGGSPLMWACEYNQVDVARVLIDRGARFDAETIVWACSRGNLDLVMLLWERGATVNMTTYFDTPLTAASKRGYVKVMRFLIDEGASVNTADEWSGRSPLHGVCNYNKPQAVQCLLEHGADINSSSWVGDTPLDLAVWSRSKQCVDLLQNVVADREIKNNRGETVNMK